MQEELYWKLRAKFFRLQEGDDNTHFIHANASSKKKTNHVNYLEADEGTRVEVDEGMCKIEGVCM